MILCGNIFRTPSLPNSPRARELKFVEKVHLPPPFVCQMSHVTSHMSGVTCDVLCVRCQVSCVTFSSSGKVVFLVNGGFVINKVYPIYFFYINFIIYCYYLLLLRTIDNTNSNLNLVCMTKLTAVHE